MHVSLALFVLLATTAAAQSRRWFAPEVHRWVTQEKLPASWEDANRRCQRDGAILASPLTTEMFNHMHSLIDAHRHSSGYFIGTRAKLSRAGQDTRWQYISVEGRRLDDMPKAVFDAIEHLEPGQDDCLSMDQHGISSVSCEELLPYICYSKETIVAPASTKPPTTSSIQPPTTTTTRPPTTSITQPPTTTTTQPPTRTTPIPSPPFGYNYNARTGSWYKVHPVYLTWNEAAATCSGEGGYLAVINDSVEAAAMWSMHSCLLAMWTGLRRPGGGAWLSVRNESLYQLYHVWGVLSPRGFHYCAGTFMTRLFEKPCNFRLCFTCEWSR